MYNKMKVSIIFLAIIAISLAEETKNIQKGKTKEPKVEETIEDILKQFETRALKTGETITSSTKDVVELAKDSFKDGVTKAQEAAKDLLKDGEDFITKYNQIKSKLEINLEECNDIFMGESSVLGSLLIKKKELEELGEELLKCPQDDIKGMGCTLGKLMRGESMMEAVAKMLKAIKGTPKERADALIEEVKKCNENVIKIATDSVNELLTKSEKCSIKDEL